jgi:hypothetical protein
MNQDAAPAARPAARAILPCFAMALNVLTAEKTKASLGSKCNDAKRNQEYRVKLLAIF